MDAVTKPTLKTSSAEHSQYAQCQLYPAWAKKELEPGLFFLGLLLNVALPLATSGSFYPVQYSERILSSTSQ